MLLFRLMFMLRGYAVIRLKGANSEKVINLLRRKGILMRDVETNDGEIRLKISYKDYERYMDAIKEAKIETVNEKGLMLKIRKLKMRKGFVAGLLILAVCLYVFSSMVWNVEVVGTSSTTAKNIMRVLEENDVTIPMTHSGIKPKEIETLLYTNFNQFKFVEVYIEGSSMLIFVKEKRLENTEIKTNEPSSIISGKNAIINKVIAKSGQPMVKEGDVVYEGQTLVMGMVKNKNSEEFMMVPSEGVIYGKIYYNFETKEEKLKNFEVGTNKNKSVYYLQKNGSSIKIIGDKNPYKNYNYKESIVKIPIISYLSDIAIIKGTYYEQAFKTVKIDENTAKNKMKIDMYDNLLKMCDQSAKILDSSLNFSEDDEYFYLRAQIEIVEDIGEKVKLYPVKDNNEEKNDEKD